MYVNQKSPFFSFLTLKGTRSQILSGIAQWYPEPEKLIGKKVIAVTNLQPRKMRGEISQGMLLSAEFGDTVQLITVPDDLIYSTSASISKRGKIGVPFLTTVVFSGRAK